MIIGVMALFPYFAYDILLEYWVKAPGECDVIASLGLGLLLLYLALYGTFSVYILFLTISAMLVTLPKC